LTLSAILLGVSSFAEQIPAFFLAPVAGVWVDRWDRHRTLVATQTLAMLQSFALAALALTGIIMVWEIILLAFAQGLWPSGPFSCNSASSVSRECHTRC
jgi:MFS family permease